MQSTLVPVRPFITRPLRLLAVQRRIGLCEIVMVPAVVAWAGYLIQGSFSAELGWWLMLTSLSLMLMAVWESKRRWSQNRAMVDNMIRAKTFEARVSSQEAQAQRGAIPNADAAKPDIGQGQIPRHLRHEHSHFTHEPDEVSRRAVFLRLPHMEQLVLDERMR